MAPFCFLSVFDQNVVGIFVFYFHGLLSVFCRAVGRFDTVIFLKLVFLKTAFGFCSEFVFMFLMTQEYS